LDLARQRGNQMLQAQATICQAYVHAARNDFQRAAELLSSLVAGMQNPVLLREVQAAQAHLSILAGDIRALIGWQSLISDDKGPRLDVQQEQEMFTLARLRIAEGKASQALEMLQDRAADAAENGRVRSQVAAFCLAALAHYADADLSQAARSLTEALTIGQAKGFRRAFLDEGPRLIALLQAVLPTLTHRALSLYATTLLHSFNPELAARHGAAVLVEPLSRQELRVLRLLVAGLSNADIAQELVVSANTVKTHVKSIYRKLDISSRDEARDVARELRLL
jgi:LuxR family maltose regulon positive regulatory protein